MIMLCTQIGCDLKAATFFKYILFKFVHDTYEHGLILESRHMTSNNVVF